MGFRTEHFHVYEGDAYFDISSKSEIERWVQIPREEWEQIVAWYVYGLRVDAALKLAEAMREA